MPRFDLRFVDSYARASRPFGITPERAWVDVDGGRLRARFGRWSLETPLTNVDSVQITGPYRFFKTAGPARLGITDLGATFASNGERGVLITFRERVRGGGPFRILKHPELTVTVADPEGLVAALRAGGSGAPSRPA